jgi:hypothetical protein
MYLGIIAIYSIMMSEKGNDSRKDIVKYMVGRNQKND